MADLHEFVSRDALIRRRTERHMPAMEAVFARANFPTFALQRHMFRALLSAFLHRLQLTELQAMTIAWHVVNEVANDVESMRAPMHNTEVDRS